MKMLARVDEIERLIKHKLAHHDSRSSHLHCQSALLHISNEHVRVAHRLAVVSNALRGVEMAKLMTAQLETACRKFRAEGPARPASPDDDLERRYLGRRDRDDGMVQISSTR